MNEIPLDEAQRLIAAIVDLAAMADRALPPRGNNLGPRLRDHPGVGDVIPNTSVSLAPIEHANLQVALDALRAEAAQTPHPPPDRRARGSSAEQAQAASLGRRTSCGAAFPSASGLGTTSSVIPSSSSDTSGAMISVVPCWCVT